MIDIQENETQCSAETILATALGQILQNNQGIILHFEEPNTESVGCCVVRLFNERTSEWKLSVHFNAAFLESTHGEMFELQVIEDDTDANNKTERVLH